MSISKKEVKFSKLHVSKVKTGSNEFFFRIMCHDFKEAVWVKLPKNGRMPKYDSKEYNLLSSDCYKKLSDSMRTVAATIPENTRELQVYRFKMQFENENSITGGYVLHNSKLLHTEYTDCVLKITDENEILFFQSIMHNLR